MPSPGSLLWSYLNILTKERFDAIVQVYGNLDEAAKHIGEEFLRGLGCREDTAHATLLRLEDFDVAKYQRALAKEGITFLDINDASYPARLREIGDPPPFLYAKGDLSILEQSCIALVGTRAMSPYGRHVTEAFVPPFVSAGFVTVSGLAKGIDGLVAEETMRAGGRTVAVLGHGLGMIYPPKHETLAREIVKKGGLLLSEFPFDFEPGKYTFPSRNRIIAGLTLGTVVLEAPIGSGAIITAELALDYNRGLFVVPGQIFDPNYEGSHALLHKGAFLATSARAVLQELGVVVSDQQMASSFVPRSDEERSVFALLTTMPQDLNSLVGRSGMDASALNATLMMLELAGGARRIDGTSWIRL